MLTNYQKNRYKDLVKERTSISGYVEEVERFSTWWSNNIATAIVYENSCYQVFLLVYVEKYNIVKVFPGDSDYGKWGDSGKSRGNHNYFLNAKNEANWLRDELTSRGKYYNNPILLIHHNCDVDKNFWEIAAEPYVHKTEIPILNNYDLDIFLNPLDIVKVKRKTRDFEIEFYHSGVYLGNRQVCHIHDLDKKNLMKARVDNIEVFLGNTEVSYRCGHMKVFCPIIPFQHWGKIIKNIVWAEDTGYREGKYDLFDRNCEHFVNMLIYRISYSEQVADFEKERRNFWIKYVKENWKSFLMRPHRWNMIVDVIKARGRSLNNGKGQFINLVNEMNEVDNELQEKSDLRADELKARIEVSPKQEDCGIM